METIFVLFVLIVAAIAAIAVIMTRSHIKELEMEVLAERFAKENFAKDSDDYFREMDSLNSKLRFSDYQVINAKKRYDELCKYRIMDTYNPKAIKIVREDKKISVSELSEFSGVSKNTIRNLENGGNTSIATLKKLSLALDTYHQVKRDEGIENILVKMVAEREDVDVDQLEIVRGTSSVEEYNGKTYYSTPDSFVVLKDEEYKKLEKKK